MKTFRLVTLFALVLSLSAAAGAWAVDDGQTRPRLSSGGLNAPSTSVDIIPLTSGSGNVKGFKCIQTPGTGFFPTLRLHFYVDGGAAQSLDLWAAVYHADANGDLVTEVPMNVRFGSSIRVNLQRYSGGGSGAVVCAVSWGLD